MDKKILKAVINNMIEGNYSLQNEFSEKIDDDSFLKNSDEVFTYDSVFVTEIKFIILKDLTEKIKEKHKNFIFAFEKETTLGKMKRTDIGFIYKVKENTYIKLNINSLQTLIDLYFQKDSFLRFEEKSFFIDNKENILVSDKTVFDAKESNYFKSKSYYKAFKNEFLEHYINENNLNIRKLVTDIFN